MTDANAIDRPAVSRPKMYLELVRFSHTVFALPFAVMALFLAYAGEWPDPRVTAIVLVCLVAARTAAMAYNRLVDRDVDALNPRTKSRHLPSGLLSVAEVAAVVLVSSAVFVVGAWFLNRLAFWLSFPVLAVLLGYSHTKRFTSASHFVLGLALGISPLGVWVAARGLPVDGGYAIPGLLGLAVLLWVAGFDILYSCQDAGFDAKHGLYSVPRRLGVSRALLLARMLHAGMIGCLALLAPLAGLGAVYAVGVTLVAALLLYEHRLVRADDLSKVDVAFFTVNGVISLLLCAFTVAEVLT